MVFTEKEKALTKILYLIMDYGQRKLMSELPGKGVKIVWIGQPHHKGA